jgi:hypothetical protein
MPAEMAIVLAIHRLELSFSLASIRDAIISKAGAKHCVREPNKDAIGKRISRKRRRLPRLGKNCHE